MSHLGRTTNYPMNRISATIVLYPTRRHHDKPERKCRDLPLAEGCVELIFHELLHTFLIQHACQSSHNSGDYGWACQRIAKAIKKESLRMLGIKIHLTRLESLTNDLKSCSIADRHIFHNLYDWGFEGKFRAARLGREQKQTRR